MTAVFGWIIFIASLLAASAAVTLPLLFVFGKTFSDRKPSRKTAALFTVAGAVALWFVIPAAIHAAFGSG